MERSYIKVFLLGGIITDLFLAIYLFSMIDQLGYAFYAFILVFLFGGTILITYLILKMNNSKK